jgi:hypothetical protein
MNISVTIHWWRKTIAGLPIVGLGRLLGRHDLRAGSMTRTLKRPTLSRL